MIEAFGHYPSSPEEELDGEISENYSGQFNLGISPLEIMATMKRFEKPGLIRAANGHITAPDFDKKVFDYTKLTEYLDKPADLLTVEQRLAVRDIAYPIKKWAESKSLGFTRGYALYILLATDAEKLCQGIPYSYEEVLERSTDQGDITKMVVGLQDITRDELPAISWLIDGLYAGEKGSTSTSAALMRAGAGLAYTHCIMLTEEVMQDLEA
jgi:hypothetical protein